MTWLLSARCVILAALLALAIALIWTVVADYE